LLIVSDCDQPYELPDVVARYLNVERLPWNPESLNTHLLRADVVLNPQAGYGRWKYKSNNKSLHAWALGIPVAHSAGELAGLMNEEARITEADGRLKEVRERWDVRQSVEEYRALISDLRSQRGYPCARGDGQR
jgi:hypothetical protein